MALTFPNRSRSYDEVKRRIRFVGHDGMFEVPFAVEVDAVPLQKPGADEDQQLAAFDAARASINDVAREVYSHGRKTTYLLTAADFR